MNHLATISAATGSKRCAQLSLGRLLRRANRLVQATIEARFGAADLGFTQWTALELIARSGSLSISDLAVSMEMNTGALSRIVEGLVARGLVGRERGVLDRRVVMLSLTDAGRRAVDAVRPAAMQRWDDVLLDLSPDDAAQLAILLGKFTASIERNALAPHRVPLEA